MKTVFEDDHAACRLSVLIRRTLQSKAANVKIRGFQIGSVNWHEDKRMIFAILLLMVSGALMGIWYGNAAGLAFFVLTTASVATILLMDISMPLTLSF